MLLLLKNVLNQEKLKSLLDTLGRATWQDGKLTAGKQAQKVKNNQQVTVQSAEGREAAQMLVSALDSDQRFTLAARPRVMTPPLFARYETGMAYGEHLDNPFIGQPRVRTDISLTVFLNAPSEYDGGELIINTDYGTQAFKADAGDAVIYPSTLLHHIKPVTRGQRLVAVAWVQSFVRDPAKRKILFDLAIATGQLLEHVPHRPEIATVQKCHHNLLRMWADS